MDTYSLLKTCDKHFKGLKINKQLVKDIRTFRISFMYKNEDITSFLGGNLTGTHIIKFSTLDDNRFYTDIANIEPVSFKEDIQNTDGMNKDFEVSTNPFNVSCMYLAYKIATSKKLSKKDIKIGMSNILMIYFYRVTTGKHTSWFKYPVTEERARAVYSNMSRRFLLKRLGTWQKVIEYRTEDFMLKDRLHYNHIREFKTKDMVETINDSYGRIPNMMKYIYSIIIEVAEGDDGVRSLGNTLKNADGQEVIKDLDSGLVKYTETLINTSTDKNTLIRKDLINVVIKFMGTSKEKYLLRSLEYISDNIVGDDSTVEELIKDMMTYSFDYLTTKGFSGDLLTVLEDVLVTIKGLWINSRGKDVLMISVKERGYELSEVSSGLSAPAAISSNRNTLFVYLLLIALVTK